MIKQIAILGAGTMGQSIATHFLMQGYEVNLFDINQQQLDLAKGNIRADLAFVASEGLIDPLTVDDRLAHLLFYDDLKSAVKTCDYVLETVLEDLAIKQTLFGELDELCPAHTIFASNTSSLPLEQIMKNLSAARRERTLISHWYNPAHLIPIIELSFFGNTTEAVYAEVERFYRSAGKQVVKVLKDVPGLVANRIQQAVAREVFSLIQLGVAAPEDIDRALKFGPAFRYATTGQLEIADFGGLDIWTIVGDNLLKVMDNSQAANPILKSKIEAGKLGFKSGEGFFTYEPDKKVAIKQQYYRRLIHQLKTSSAYIE